MLAELQATLMKLLPTAALFLAVIVGGLIGSAIARRVARWAIEKTGLDALAEKAGAARLLYAVGVRKGVSHVIGSLVYAAGVLVTAAAAADVLGLTAVADGAAALIAFLPRLAAAGLVLGAGVGLAGLVRGTALTFGRRRPDVEQPELLGNLAYYGIMAIAVIVAAGQAGIETSLIETLLTTLAAIIIAAVGLAFALGSRASFHNLVAGHFMRRLIRPGDSLKLPEVEGVVVRYFGVCVVVRTAHGEVTVPCKVLLDQNVGLERLGAKERARQESGPDAASDLPG
jgi:hypothetical protein